MFLHVNIFQHIIRYITIIVDLEVLVTYKEELTYLNLDSVVNYLLSFAQSIRYSMKLEQERQRYDII